MIPFRYKPDLPPGSPDHDGEAELGKSRDEKQDHYYDYVDDVVKEEKLIRKGNEYGN